METLDLLKQLELNYKLISNDLDFASHKIDTFLTNAPRTDSSMPDLHALQSRIHTLQATMATLAKDAVEVVRDKKERESALNTSLLESYNMMVRVYARLSVAPDPDWVEVADDIKAFAPRLANDETDCIEEAGGRQQGHEGSPGNAQDDKDGVGLVGAHRAEDERRQARSSGIISEEEFLGVAANIRGRCKLEDVRKVYAKIREDFEEKSNRGRHSSKLKPITKKELDAAGLKVFGLTGDGVLNTLRALGLIAVAKNGITLSSS